MTTEPPLPALYDSLAERMGDPANFAPLTPISFLARTADVHPDHESVVYRERRYTWRETERRCQGLAHGLRRLGVGAHDTVSVLLFNTPEMLECHFGVPLAGAVLNTINVRLESDTVAYIMDFAEARALIVDRELLPVALAGLAARADKGVDVPVILVDDPHAGGAPDVPDDLDVHPYEALVESAAVEPADYLPATVGDELHPLSINFTSGTTGRPKGVVYHHRGAALMSLGTIAGWAIPRHPRYLYLVPMFHCNGWCHVWTMTAMAATVHCMRAVVPERVFEVVREEGITHFGGAPIVLNMLAGAKDAPARLAEDRVVHCMTAGAPPPAAVLGRMESMGCEIIHTYGLTETYGHILECEPQPAWASDDAATLAERKARQGVRFPTVEGVRVVDRESGAEVPPDAATIGEIEIRGNLVMTGYLKNPEATDRGARGRLVPERGPRRAPPRRLRADPGPRQGHHHLGRGEHLVGRDRERALQAPRRRRGGGRGDARREVGRDPVRLRRARRRPRGERGGADRALRGHPRALQEALPRRVRSAAEDRDGQDPEVRAARARDVDLNDPTTRRPS